MKPAPTTKVTLATLKAFLRANDGKLYVNQMSSFDGMTDCVQQCEGGFRKVEDPIDLSKSNTLGVRGLWLVGGSRDYIARYDKDGFIGMQVSNCCGSAVVAIRQEEA